MPSTTCSSRSTRTDSARLSSARAALERDRAADQQARLAALLDRLAAGVAGAGGDAGTVGGVPHTPVPALTADAAPPPNVPAPARYLERLLIKSGGRVFFVRTAEIDWIEAAGNYLRLHVGREAHLLRETMA